MCSAPGPASKYLLPYFQAASRCRKQGGAKSESDGGRVRRLLGAKSIDRSAENLREMELGEARVAVDLQVIGFPANQ